MTGTSGTEKQQLECERTGQRDLSNGAPADLPRKVGFWGAIAVMVGIVIGSGIFATPTTIAQNLGSPTLILALWVAAGSSRCAAR